MSHALGQIFQIFIVKYYFFGGFVLWLEPHFNVNGVSIILWVWGFSSEVWFWRLIFYVMRLQNAIDINFLIQFMFTLNLDSYSFQMSVKHEKIHVHIFTCVCDFVNFDSVGCQFSNTQQVQAKSYTNVWLVFFGQCNKQTTFINMNFIYVSYNTHAFLFPFFPSCCVFLLNSNLPS